MHNKIQAKLLLDATLESLNAYQLKPLPDNYRLWFEYATGSIDALNKDIDERVSQHQTFTEAICRQLYIKHIASDDQRNVDDARAAIHDMLNAIVEHLKDWDTSTSSFCDGLLDCLTKLGANPGLEEVKDIIATVTSEVKQVRTTNHCIKTSLDNLSSEISALRQDVDRLGNQAMTDPLTQVMNRRGFDAALENITEEVLTEGLQSALIIIDLDNFKQINDNFGHQVGDKILRYAAATFRKGIRGSDILARYGGEEFAIILPHTSYNGAMQVAENLRQAISARQLTTGSNGKIIGRLTASFGVSSYRKTESPSEFFDRVDQAMYRAKKAGKDRVVGEE